MNYYIFFYKIYCINLKNRNDKYKSAINTFKKLNIKNITFFLQINIKKVVDMVV